ncbi:MAG TPA: phosphatase PAP2 family protein [Streptosporangiaceae bacterium]|jgi:undecaprenyl-diphosphatase|nr:phosphatase PAP2 family protein [Streptosporangiaceae bacterium]
MSARTLGQPRRTLTPLVTVTVAALVFAVLLVLVRLQWPPLESIDHGAAARINHLIAGSHALVTVVKAVTWLGSNGVLWVVIGAAAAGLALRKRWRLAIYLLVTGAGALVLDPVLKSLVGRLRPVVAHPIAHGSGDSFPSGHSLGSIVCYGAVLLVFLPAARGRWRPAFVTVTVALVALIGISRILLGVHYLSDVLGAWALGITWLGVTTFAFELTRRAAGQPVTGPVTEGLEPEARADLRPAQPEPPAGRARTLRNGRVAAGIVVAWVLILGIIVGLGELVTKDGNGNVLGDRTIPHWLAAHRTPGLTRWSHIFSTLGAAQAILIVSLTTCVVFLAITRRWRPVIFIATLMVGEFGAFIAAAVVVMRPRPDVTQLDHHLPTSAYPSGHEAATCCLYVAVAILVIGHARGWWRWLFLVPAVAMPVLVALSRMYRGEHHPTDILGSLLFSALWLTATTLLIKPNADSRPSGRDSRRPGTRSSGVRPSGRPSRIADRLRA